MANVGGQAAAYGYCTLCKQSKDTYFRNPECIPIAETAETEVMSRS